MSSTSGEVWTTRVLPILEAVRASEGNDDFLEVGRLSVLTGLSNDEVDLELGRLIQSGYISGDYEKFMSGGDKSGWFLTDPMLTERGARCVGLWPSDDPYELLMELLDKRIDQENDEDERTKWQRFRGTAAEVGKGAVAGLLVEIVKAGSGVRF